MENKLQSDLIQNFTNAKEQRDNDLNFAIISLAMQNFTVYLIKEGNEEIKEIKKALSYYKDSSISLKKNGVEYQKILFDKIYVNFYQIFEEFCYKNMLCLFLRLPKFLMKDEINVSYKDIFMQTDIEIIKQNIVEKRVKSIIQSSNIYGIIKKFKTVFGIDFKIDKESQDRLFIISQNRNLLIHTKGIVNNIYISELEKFGLRTDLKIGEHILKGYNNFSDFHDIEYFIETTIESITATMLVDINRLINYHENLK
ncbi:hypothetical protein A7A78_08630 [Aequorivita soesokkakensis]|uniref:MAE-28990/MAE-18760-like HEPN domain-containing protein n=1 Tax=Aequorivita soesokkakensis TaxID=1385699 RepID=A0A1A9LHE2_9FLAO|nr:hypothetical protein [Aequorivita soesokkakensis]OAD92294.1 hypothetical protein A7A78_08630 [Aequorivita soesokkakensis]